VGTQGGGMAGHRRCVRALLAVVATTGGMTVGTALAPATAGAETTSVAIGAVTAHVFANPNDSGEFDRTPADTEEFTQSFPVVNFNPPADTVPCTNATNVDEITRPFTDVVEQSDGSCSAIVMEGHAPGSDVVEQAGVDSLFDFEVVFDSTLTVAAPGDVDLAFFSDDGWILGVGPGPGGATATQVSGASENAPTASPMHGYPVVGAFNTPTAPVGNVTTVHFPAAGSYPVELDYTECCAGELSFTVTANGAPIPPQPPADSSSLAYTGPRTLEFHDPATLSGRLSTPNVTAGLPVVFTLASSMQSCTGSTDASGAVACDIVPSAPGGDTTVTMTFAGTAANPPATSRTAVTVLREETAVGLAADHSVVRGHDLAVAATLTEDGVDAVAGATVAFVLGTGANAPGCSASTDAGGRAACTIHDVRLDGGDSPLTASFAGDDFRLPAASTGTVTVQVPTRLIAEPLVLTTGPVLVVNAPHVSAQLLDDRGRGVRGKTIVFSAGGSELCRAQTNGSGVAACSSIPTWLNAVLALGDHAVFAGDAVYLPAAADAGLIGTAG